MRMGTSLGLGLGIGMPVGAQGFAASLMLDFLTTTSLDSRITFSRGSQAMVTDATGKLTYAPNNLLTYSEQFDNAAWFKSAGTSVTADATTAPDGTTTADRWIKGSGTTGAADLYRGMGVVTLGVAHSFSFYAKANGIPAVRVVGGGSYSPTGFTRFNLDLGTVATGTGSIQAMGNGWYRCTIFITRTGSFDDAVYIAPCDADGTFPTGDGTSGIYIWGAQLEAVTYQTTPGTYNATTSAAYYGPRFDYDPVTLAAKGLLIEEQRTNLLLRSEQFDNGGAWIKAGGSVTANVTPSPDGTITADKLVEDTSSGGHYVSAVSSVTSGTAYTISVYVKAAGRSWVRVVFGAGFTTTNTWFDIANGTVGTVGATSASIQNAGNGWYRITATQSATSSTSGQFFIAAETSGSSTSYTGNGTSGVYLWGAQLEAGSFATSYIPTTASTATRSADVATMTGANFSSWYNQTAGTFVVGFTPDEGLIGSATRVIGTNAGGISARVVDINYLGTNWVNYNGTVNTVIGPAVATSALQKVAAAYAPSNYGYSLNGGTVATDSTNLVNSPTQLSVGSLSGGNFLNGHIRILTYYPSRLPNATLQSLTA